MGLTSLTTVLVTGGAGFIGPHVTAELLRRGRVVRVLDNFSTGSRASLPAVVRKLVEGAVRSDERSNLPLNGVPTCTAPRRPGPPELTGSSYGGVHATRGRVPRLRWALWIRIVLGSCWPGVSPRPALSRACMSILESPTASAIPKATAPRRDNVRLMRRPAMGSSPIRRLRQHGCTGRVRHGGALFDGLRPAARARGGGRAARADRGGSRAERASPRTPVGGPKHCGSLRRLNRRGALRAFVSAGSWPSTASPGRAEHAPGRRAIYRTAAPDGTRTHAPGVAHTQPHRLRDRAMARTAP